jgi:cyanophycinase-like exopeptidase
MNRSGPIALIGGGEHREATEPIDRRLMDYTGKDRVQVAVVPVASSPHKLPSAAALARNYWTALGARVAFALPGEKPPQMALDALAEPDIIVLTGGVPDRVVTALGASTVWDRILELWTNGAALSGSSAGSMALFEWRLRLYPPHPFQLVPGLGPLSHFVSLPHFDRYVMGHHWRFDWLHHAAESFQGAGILGLDEGTGLVGWDGRYSVLGRGAVTVLDEGRWQTYPRGASADLELDPIPTRVIEVPSSSRHQRQQQPA